MKEKEAFDSTLRKIGSKLKDLRVKRGYTSHEDFAYDNDIPRVQYWRIEKGNANLTMKSLARLLAIHKMTIEEFFVALSKENKK